MSVGATPRLTSFSHGAGCGCKLGPAQLAEALGGLSLPGLPPEALVGADTSDDAAVYRLGDGLAVVATIDFFTPIVDDPYDWGRIAAVNAMSDVYAMGARPILGLNVVAWPVDDLPGELLTRVLQGGADAAGDAGFPVLGGHSISDPEPKYGMVVLGTVDPAAMTTNAEARPGDALVLTKPLGLGIITTAVKRGLATPELEAAAVEVMTTPNAAAAEAMGEAGVRAATDVTGFGLTGHLREMLVASGVAARLDASAVPLVPGALALSREGSVPGGTQRNHAFVSPSVDWGDLPEPEQLVLADAQTSGGLLIAAPDPAALSAALDSRGVTAAVIGEVVPGDPSGIRVTGRLRDGNN